MNSSADPSRRAKPTGAAAVMLAAGGVLAGLATAPHSASPVAATPQGIAVYMNGTRFNEAFGDTVNCVLYFARSLAFS